MCNIIFFHQTSWLLLSNFMFEKISGLILWHLILFTWLCVHILPQFSWLNYWYDTSSLSLWVTIYELVLYDVYTFSLVVKFILDWYVLVCFFPRYPLLGSKLIHSLNLLVLIFKFIFYMFYCLLLLFHVPIRPRRSLLWLNHRRHHFHRHPHKLFLLYDI